MNKQNFKVDFMDVTAVIPYEENPRQIGPDAVAKVAKSIKKYGFVSPIIVNDENVVLAGHTRLQAAISLGLEQVPVHTKSGLSEAAQRAYRLADNRVAEESQWDFPMLTEELSFLKDEDFDLTFTGFDPSELANFFPDEPIEGLTDEDEVPEVQDDPVSVLGDVWTLGNHRLMCGDSTSIDAVENLMDGNKADMVFTDPPYGVSYEGGHNKKKRNQIIADNLDGEDLTTLFHSSILSLISNTKKGAAFYIWYASGKSIETYAALSQLPLTLRAVIQWYKVKSGLGAFMSQYIPNCEPCMYLHKTGCSPAWYGSTTEKTVWEQKKEPRNDFHPTQKPVEISERAITNSSKMGDEILDIFGGSGSTLIACEKTTRHCRMMELDPKYCDVIIKRWQEFTGKQAVLLSTNETFDALKEQRCKAA